VPFPYISCTQGENLPYGKCCIQLTGPRHNR